MQLDNPKRLVVEDFDQKDQALVSRLAETLNGFQEQVVNALNGNIQIDNLDREIIEFKVQVSSSGIPLQTTKFSASVGVKGSNVLRADNGTNPAKFVVSAPFVSFSPLGNGIYQVNHVTGLHASDKYTIRLELVP